MAKTLDTNAPTGGVRRTKFQIMRRRPNAPYHVEHNGKTYKLGRSGAAHISDPGVARELFERHHAGVGNGDFLVAPVEKPIEPGHPRTWLVKLPYEKGFTGNKT